MVDFNELSDKSKKAYRVNKTLLYLFYLMSLILFFQLGRSLIAFHYHLLDLVHLARVNGYLIGVGIMAPTILKELNFRIEKAKSNEM